ncbi:hypothetical protein P43SY_007672 [Pythium insidiosum]|uniref:Calcineurin-like phosphoesterase domain-containing protein n=1 Tax=Pythium insidiosum TaxID=114742 RepID=A0AAD5M4V4_PYTIN|nr:hypothetical protein P43SY_007672 [Pythium insidiosum]
MRCVSTWRLLAFLSSVASCAGSVKLAAPTTVLEPFAVSNLRVAVGFEPNVALVDCQGDTGDWVPVGVDWGMWLASSERVVHLCQRRVRISDQDGSALPDIPDNQQILQRLAAVVVDPSKNASCPTNWSTLHDPRPGIVLCAKYTSLEAARVTKDYVVDLSVTYERYYNDAVPGWTTLPVSIHERRNDTHEQPYRGVYLHVRRPIAPLTNLTVLESVEAGRATLDECESKLGLGWRPATPDVHNQTRSVQADGKTPLVCVTRTVSNSSVAGQYIANVELINANATNTCGDEGNLQIRHDLRDSTALCVTMATPNDSPLPGNRTFVNDLVLRQLDDPTLAAKDLAALLNSHFEWLATGNTSLETAEALSVATERSTRWHWWQRRVTTLDASSSASVPEDERSIRNKSRLRAVVRKNQTLSFKVVQFADLHFKGNASYPCMNTPEWMDPSKCTESVMNQFIDDVLDVEKPDLVVFSGDNDEAYNESYATVAIEQFTRAVVARGIPHVEILGNHDAENLWDRGALLDEIIATQHSLTSRGPAEVAGDGNYILNVLAPEDGPWGPKGTDVFRMYFLDSHAYPNYTRFPDNWSNYAWIEQSQVAYYRRAAASHQSLVPSIMFFHIALVEYTGAPTQMSTPLRIGSVYRDYVGCSDVDSHLFSALRDYGDVKATFVGHDHLNDFCYKREDIQLCYGGGAGLGRAYGSMYTPRRARVIEWTVNAQNERRITSWHRYHGALAGKHNHQVVYSERPDDAGRSLLDEDAKTGQTSREAIVRILVPMAIMFGGVIVVDVTILQLVSAGKLQPTLLPSCPEAIVKLARACMAFDPAQRPSAIHISYELRKILKDVA